MADEPGPRADAFARRFDAAQASFIELIESLTDEQWRAVGRNYPERLNDEDERRTVGVIAHHVAVSTPWILDRIQAMLDGRPLPPADIRVANATQAAEHADVTKTEVLQLLREQRQPVSAAIRAIPDDRLDQALETPAGPMSVAQRLERVLLGHIEMHRGSIEAAVG